MDYGWLNTTRGRVRIPPFACEVSLGSGLVKQCGSTLRFDTRKDEKCGLGATSIRAHPYFHNGTSLLHRGTSKTMEKEELKKWVKFLDNEDKKQNDNAHQVSIAHFIDFFNLTEEDLV